MFLGSFFLCLIAGLRGWVTVILKEKNSPVVLLLAFILVFLIWRLVVIPVGDLRISSYEAKHPEPFGFTFAMVLVAFNFIVKGPVLLSTLFVAIAIRKLVQNLQFRAEEMEDQGSLILRPTARKNLLRNPDFLASLSLLTICGLMFAAVRFGFGRLLVNVCYVLSGRPWFPSFDLAGIGTILQFVVFFAVFLAVLIASIKGSNQYLPKYDTQLRVLMIYFLLAMLVALVCAMTFMVYERATEKFGFLSIILSLALVSCVPLALVSYAIVGNMIMKIFRTEPVSAESTVSNASREIIDASERERIRRPEILISQIPFLSPQVLGTPKKAYVVLPSNYTDIFQSIESKVGSEKKGTLQKFLLNHELVHLRNEDYILFTWLSCFMRILLRVWWPACSLTVLLLVLVKGSINFSWLLYTCILFPLLNIGLLYFLMLSVLRDRELLADHHSLDSLEEGSRRSILDSTVNLGKEIISPLGLLFRMFPARQSPLLGISVATNSDANVPGASRNILDKLARFVRRILRPFFETHPGEASRIEALSSKSDPLLIKQGEKENGAFLGLMMGLVYFYWGAVFRVFYYQPSDRGFFLTTLIMSGIMAASAFLPARHIQGGKMSFEEYDRMTRLKLIYACVGFILFVAVLTSLVVTPSALFLVVRVGVFVSLGAYVFWLIVFALAVASGKLNFPQKGTLWRVWMRVIIGLLIMGIFIE